MSSIGGFKRRQPKSIQSRRALKKLEPKVFENPKKALFLRGQNTSEVITDALTDLFNILKPNCKRLRKRNAFHPWEGQEHLEFLGFKNDCSMFAFGSDSKKRPHNLVLGRHFDFHVLDMIELGILAMDRMEIGNAQGQTCCSVGSKPLFVFEGSEFTSDPFFVRLKNFLVDFFGGHVGTELNIDGCDRAIFCSLRSQSGEDAVVAPSDDCKGTKPQANKGNAVLCFRHFGVIKPQTTTKATLVDIGPNFDFEIRRVQFAPPADFKKACRIPREALAHLKHLHENVAEDGLGNLRGQLHMGKQDLSELALRRFAGKKHRMVPTAAADGVPGGAAEGGDDELAKKRKRRGPKVEFMTDGVNLDTDI